MSHQFGILYICTGKYKIFWEQFYESSQKYLLTNNYYEKTYFVFTDAKYIAYESNKNVHKIYQENLTWPFITLFRFKIFLKILPQLKQMDFIFFFNANMLFVDYIGMEILPSEEKPLTFLIHPGYMDKNKNEFNYERNPESNAYIPFNEGIHYYAGGLNGGLKDKYLAMLIELMARIDEDYEKGIIAIWHDESHINKYGFENQQFITGLSTEYGWPQGWMAENKPKIIILDKNNFGGHSYLRSKKIKYIFVIEQLLTKTKKFTTNYLKRIKQKVIN